MKKLLLASVVVLAMTKGALAADCPYENQNATLVKEYNALAGQNVLGKCTPDNLSKSKEMLSILKQISSVVANASKDKGCRVTPGNRNERIQRVESYIKACSSDGKSTGGPLDSAINKLRELADEAGRKAEESGRRIAETQRKAAARGLLQDAPMFDKNGMIPRDKKFAGGENCNTSERGTLDVSPNRNCSASIPTPKYDRYGLENRPPKGTAIREFQKSGRNVVSSSVPNSPGYWTPSDGHYNFTPPSPHDAGNSDLRAPATTANGRKERGKWIAPSHDDPNIMAWCQRTNDHDKIAVIGMAYWYDMCVSDGEGLRWKLREGNGMSKSSSPDRIPNACHAGFGLKPDPKGFGHWKCEDLWTKDSWKDPALRAIAEDHLRATLKYDSSIRTAKGDDLRRALAAVIGEYNAAHDAYLEMDKDTGDVDNLSNANGEAKRLAMMKFLEDVKAGVPFDDNACVTHGSLWISAGWHGSDPAGQASVESLKKQIEKVCAPVQKKKDEDYKKGIAYKSEVAQENPSIINEVAR
jgi:hypothetical protein